MLRSERSIWGPQSQGLRKSVARSCDAKCWAITSTSSTKRSLYGRKLSAALESSRNVLASDYIVATRRRHAIVAELEQALSGVDVVLTPATPGPPPRDLSSTGSASYQMPWSVAGLPAIALPVAINADGLPLAIQIVGQGWRDGDLLQSRRCESALDFTAHPPIWENWRRSDRSCTTGTGLRSLLTDNRSAPPQVAK